MRQSLPDRATPFASGKASALGFRTQNFRLRFLSRPRPSLPDTLSRLQPGAFLLPPFSRGRLPMRSRTLHRRSFGLNPRAASRSSNPAATPSDHLNRQKKFPRRFHHSARESTTQMNSVPPWHTIFSSSSAPPPPLINRAGRLACSAPVRLSHFVRSVDVIISSSGSSTSALHPHASATSPVRNCIRRRQAANVQLPRRQDADKQASPSSPAPAPDASRRS